MRRRGGSARVLYDLKLLHSEIQRHRREARNRFTPTKLISYLRILLADAEPGRICRKAIGRLVRKRTISLYQSCSSRPLNFKGTPKVDPGFAIFACVTIVGHHCINFDACSHGPTLIQPFLRKNPVSPAPFHIGFSARVRMMLRSPQMTIQSPSF